MRSRAAEIDLDAVYGNGTFCVEPWTHLTADVRGDWTLCCVARAMAYDQPRGPLEHYNSKDVQASRRAMLRGKRRAVSRYCSPCHQIEDRSGISRRMIRNDEVLNDVRLKPLLDEMVTQSFLAPGKDVTPNHINIDMKVFGNTCNLRCYMCGPDSSSSWGNEKKRSGDLAASHASQVIAWNDSWTEEQRRKFWEDVEALLPVVHNVKFTGGEPLLNRLHYDLVDFIVRSGHAGGLTLTYISNTTRLPSLKGKTVFDYLEHFKRVEWLCSIDNLGDKNDYMRYPSRFGSIMDNVRMLSSLENVTVSIFVTVSLLNALDITGLYDFFESDRVIDGRIDFSNHLLNPDYLQCWNLPEPLKKEAIRKLTQHKQSEKFIPIVKLLSNPSREKKWREAVRFLRRLDSRRGTNLLQTFPKLTPYVE
ncbi:MAG: radical SAM protein [Lentisphaerae bacterium]|nr:radical SAM protein [Lentisphaerota bacterium]